MPDHAFDLAHDHVAGDGADLGVTAVVGVVAVVFEEVTLTLLYISSDTCICSICGGYGIVSFLGIQTRCVHFPLFGFTKGGHGKRFGR